MKIMIILSIAKFLSLLTLMKLFSFLEIIFSKDYTEIGIGISNHTKHGKVYVFVLASNTSSEDSNDIISEDIIEKMKNENMLDDTKTNSKIAHWNTTNLNENHLSILNSYLKWHNELRSNPKSFIEHCEIRLGYMKGDFYWYPGKINIKTEEGIVAINETVKFLLSQKPNAANLELDTVLWKVAQKHADDLGK